MLLSAKLLPFSFSCGSGLLKKARWPMLKHLLLLWRILSVTYVDSHSLEGQMLSSPTLPTAVDAIPDLPLRASLPFTHGPHWRYLSPHTVSRILLVPNHPPDYGPFVTTAQPPSRSRLSDPSMRKRSTVLPSPRLAPPHFEEIAPIQPGASTLPTGLAQPPLSPHTSNCCRPNMVLRRGSRDCHCAYPVRIDLLLLNVSSNPNWNNFLDEFAAGLDLNVSQIELIDFYVLNLSTLNISMDITPPPNGISFSPNEAAAINSSLSFRKIRVDPLLVGDYQLLNMTWFQPPASSQAPPAISPAKAPPQLPSTPATLVSPNQGKHSSLILVIAIGASILLIAIVTVLIICHCASQGGKKNVKNKAVAKPTAPPASDSAPSVRSVPHLTSTRFLKYEELREATNNFEPASILGEGGFGQVFKGVLADGTAVAIKRLTNGGQQGDKEFLVEVEMLSRLHHRNLVKLVGYYTSRDSSQNLLCYELVPNGSLESWLHGPLGVNCPLDWDTRMRIALDAARGLAYLHEDSQPCVIHRDFKASNILLENNFQAKVADFGLAKLAPEGRGNYLSTRVMGTFGYVAPEYAMTGHLLVKSDVYSYGVVLLELLTGRKPVEMSQPSGQENLVTWARPILRDKDRLEELADPQLEGKYPKEDFGRVCTIAAACVASEASQRPTMGEVVQSLKMVQRVGEYQDHHALTSNNNNNRPTNVRHSSVNFESDGTSSIFSSGPYSGLSVLDHDNISRTPVFSEDLREGR